MIDGMNPELVQYERAKQNIEKMLPPRIEHDFNLQQHKIDELTQQLTADLKSSITSISSDFETGASGKAADKIKSNLEQIKQQSVNSNLYFGF